MTFKIKAAARLQATKIQANNQKEAGELLSKLKPILGAEFKKKNQGNLQEVVWKNPEFTAIIELDIDDHLSFHFIGRQQSGDIDFSAESFDKEDSTKKILTNIRYEISHINAKDVKRCSAEVQNLLKKLAKIR